MKRRSRRRRPDKPRDSAPASGHPLRRPDAGPSRAIYDAVLDATSELMCSVGFGKMSSNKIAKRAGVSIGSFYRYFANKKVVVAELARRHEQRTLARAGSHFGDVATGDPRAVAQALIGVLINDDATPIQLRRAVLQQIPRGWVDEANKDTAGTVQAMVRGYLESRKDSVRDADVEIMAFVLVRATEGVVAAALLERPELLEDKRLEDELVHMVVSYLEPVTG